MIDRNKKKAQGGGPLGERWLAIIVVVVVSAVSFSLGYFVGGTAGREGLMPSQQSKIEPLPIQEPIAPIQQPQQPSRAVPQDDAKPGDTGGGFDAMPPADAHPASTPPMKPKSSAMPVEKPAKPLPQQQPQKPAAQKTAASAAAKPTAAPPFKPASLYAVQVGAFKAQAEADALKKKLAAKGYTATVTKSQTRADAAPYKLRLGYFKDKKEADALYAKISKDMGLKGFVAKVD